MKYIIHCSIDIDNESFCWTAFDAFLMESWKKGFPQQKDGLNLYEHRHDANGIAYAYGKDGLKAFMRDFRAWKRRTHKQEKVRVRVFNDHLRLLKEYCQIF